MQGVRSLMVTLESISPLHKHCNRAVALALNSDSQRKLLHPLQVKEPQLVYLVQGSLMLLKGGMMIFMIDFQMANRFCAVSKDV
mmetsp:Transcript_8755/g.53821  ORF Transcript_8755/g.53821 Transcript_8755/m.53821 type:complete len:84 (+) Transcript_8755:2355-2606(+)